MPNFSGWLMGRKLEQLPASMKPIIWGFMNAAQ